MVSEKDVSTADASDVPLVVHVLYRFDCGGLQTVLAECINHIPAHRYRHAVICLAGYTAYASRIRSAGVQLYELDKVPGQGLATHIRLWKLLRQLRPAIIHTYNIGTIEYNLTALLAGVPVRIHSEHGRDSVEIDGKHRKYNWLRYLLSPIINTFVPVSADLVDWLRLIVKIPTHKIVMIPNGVNTLHYAPCPDMNAAPTHLCIGTVGRTDPIKNHTVLLDAFELLLARFPAATHDLRLTIVGDGPLLQSLRRRVATRGLEDRVWLPGARADVADILRRFSVFVLPSLSEAAPVTILEAMATAVPVVASRVGGVSQLVPEGQAGALVEPDDANALADALSAYIDDPEKRIAHGLAGRAHVESKYSIDVMVAAYMSLYDGCRCDAAPTNGPLFEHRPLI